MILKKHPFCKVGNSLFIKELYLKYLKDPNSIPQSWIEFFDGLNEDQKVIQEEILGPSWAPKKSNSLQGNIIETNKNEDKYKKIH